MERKGGTVCVCRGCFSRTGEGISLFTFPKDRLRTEIWLKNCNRQDLLTKTVDDLRKNYKVCENHFEDKYISKNGGMRKYLLQQAIPTIFPYQPKQSASKDRSCEASPKKVVITSDQSIDPCRKQTVKSDISVLGSFNTPDPLPPIQTPMLNFSLLKNTTDDIQLVVEDYHDGDDLGANSNTIIIHLVGPEETNVQQTSITEAPVLEEIDTIDLTSSLNDEEMKIEEIIKIEETKIRGMHGNPKIDLLEISEISELSKDGKGNSEGTSGMHDNPKIDLLKISEIPEVLKDGKGNSESIRGMHNNPKIDLLETSEIPELSKDRKGNSEVTESSKRVCYVPQCKVTDQDKGNVFWFNVPRDENIRKMWDICIDHSDKRLGYQDFICHKHFSKEDLIYQYNIPRQNNRITVVNDKTTLREGAVPCIKFHDECCVPTCRKKDGRMYCFPVANRADFRLWCYMVQNPILKNLKIKELLRYRVCEKHFDSDCFDDKFGLKRSAAPTLYLPATLAMVDFTKIKPISLGEMANFAKSCISLNCIHGKCNNRSNINKNVFQFPLDPDRCIAWLRACGKEEYITTPTETVKSLQMRAFGVCEDHFNFHSFESTLDKLKPNAIPRHHRFPNIDLIDYKQIYSEQMKEQARLAKVPNVVGTPTVSLSKENISTVPSIKPIVCFYMNCKIKSSENTKFFSFPTEKERYDAWFKACGYSNLRPGVKLILSSTKKICRKHFKRNMFDVDDNLKSDAVPNDHICLNTANSNNVEDATSGATKAVPPTEPKPNKVYCAVSKCGNFYGSTCGKGLYHKFPDPITDEERYNIWLSLLMNANLSKKTDEQICQQYMVCFKHFESHFYEYGAKSNTLTENAVPTLNIPGDIEWFYSSDYYKSRLEDSYNDLLTDISAEKAVGWKKDDVINYIDHEKTTCILEEDRIRFPGIGYCIYMEETEKGSDRGKRKFPYSVYKRFRTGYGLNDNIQVGESIKIHTAIVIDDDDDCERAVLQQLLDKRKRKR